MAPRGWSQRRIGDFAKRKKTINDAGADLPPLSVTKDRGVVLQSDKYNKRVATDPKKYLIVKDADFAFDPMGLYYGALGRVVGLGRGLISPDYVSFTVDDSVDPVFVEYALRSPEMIRKYNVVAQAGNQFGKRRRVYWSVLQELELLQPPLPEQRKIAAILSSVDETIQKTEAVIDQLEVVKNALLEDVLSRGVPGRHSAFKTTELGNLPSAWRCTSLGDALERIDAGWSPLCDSEPARPGEWGVLKVSSVTWGEFRPEENKRLPTGVMPRPETEVRQGDLLVSRANTRELVGRAVVVRTVPPHLMASDKLLRLRPRTDRAVAPFLNYVLATEMSRAQIEDAATGSSGSMKNISQEKLRAILIPLPPLEEQALIVEILDAACERLVAERRLVNLLRATKVALIDALLSGSLRVNVSAQEAA